MAKIYINKKEYTVDNKKNLLETCLSLGFDIPYFCWHPELGSVGSCRQCAVMQYQKNNKRLIMSCMTPSIDGMVISIDDTESKKFRKMIIEWLMTNHPHDCPVCEEGGHCHLQDMTVMVGHNIRRYRFQKRTYYNQNLGPFISHQMNRCISCYRCVRYYKDYADGSDFGVYGIHNNLYFGRFEDGMLENEFSGNLVDVCPTGVFTDKVYSKNFTRKWDMQFAPSICHECSIGCNIILGERDGIIRKVDNRYHKDINRYFLCDRGRFGYEYLNLKTRPKIPKQRLENKWIPLSFNEVLKNTVDILKKSKKTIGIGSPRASMESNFALMELVGRKNFFTGMMNTEQTCLSLILKILNTIGVHTPTLYEIETYDAILILGEDLTQTSPRASLSVRQAIKNKTKNAAKEKNIPNWDAFSIKNTSQEYYPLFITNIDQTKLDDIATWTYYAPIQDQARFGFALAHMLNKKAPYVHNIPSHLEKRILKIAKTLLHAKKTLIISGSSYYNLSIIEAASNIARALKTKKRDVGIMFFPSDANSIGLSMMKGQALDKMLDEVESHPAEVIIILENDIHRQISEKKINKIINKKSKLIVLDHQNTEIMDLADIVVPVSNFAESDGTLINQEGRVQRFFRVYNPNWYNKNTTVLESWRWLNLIATKIGNQVHTWNNVDDVIKKIIDTFPDLSLMKFNILDENFRIHGQKIASSPHRYSGRTALQAHINVHEQRQDNNQNSIFSFSMEGNSSSYSNYQNIPFVWAPGWNSVQAWNKFQDEIGGSLRAGNSGTRLFNVLENDKNKLSWFKNIPNAFNKIEDVWYIVPYYYLFFNYEMVQKSPHIKKLNLQPYLILHEHDAKKININNESIVNFTCMNKNFSLPVRLSKNLHSGLAGLPLGMSHIPKYFSEKKIYNLSKEK